MKGSKGEEAGGGRPAAQSSRRIEQDPNDVNRRNIEIDKYLAGQGDVPEVRKA
jgi:hypothetical protein